MQKYHTLAQMQEISRISSRRQISDMYAADRWSQGDHLRRARSEIDMAFY